MNLSPLLTLDQNIATWINQTFTNSAFDAFFPVYTDLHKNIYVALPLVAFILYSFIRKFKTPGLIHFFFLILTVATSDFTGSVIKNRVERLRPFANTELKMVQRSPANPNKSFYSNHASNSFAMVFYVSQFFPQGKVIYYSLAALVAYSRVYNGVHYPSDVVSGALAGILMAWLFSTLSKKTYSYFQKKGSS